MAELLLKVKEAPNWDDGDIVCAFNDRHISQVHAQEICHPREVGFNSEGLRNHDTLVEVFLRTVNQFRFERISVTEISRYNQWTDEIDIIGAIPNDKGEYMDVEMFLKRRRKHARHVIFGKVGSEIWYGGKMDCSDERLSIIWADIEDRTDKKKADHVLWPLSDTEKAHFLGLSVDGFDDEESTKLTASEVDESDPDNIVVIKKRVNLVAYADMGVMSGDTLAHIADPKVIVDVRGEDKVNKRAEIVQVKK